jgi:hypothetical protein
MFDITTDDIRQLSDAELRELTARLCEAEVTKFGFSAASVTWGGHQDAPDGGIDVRVEVDAVVQTLGWIPRPATGLQVKKKSMPRAEILKEMRPEMLSERSLRISPPDQAHTLSSALKMLLIWR